MSPWAIFSLVFATVLSPFIAVAGMFWLMRRESRKAKEALQLAVDVEPTVPPGAYRFRAHPVNGGGIICDIPEQWVNQMTPGERIAFHAHLGALAVQQQRWN